MDEHTLFSLLIAGGAICIVAAIVGGGLSVHVVSIPAMSRARQIVLAIFGFVLAVIGFLNLRETPDTQVEVPAQDAPASEDSGAAQSGDAPK